MFIINPIAGGAAKGKELALLRQEISSRPDYQIKVTGYPGHAIKIVEAAKRDCSRIVAVGGDGTVNEVAGALAGTGVALGIIPFGSGNGLAHHLQIPLHWRAALATCEKSTPRPIDIIAVNNRIVINVGGLGFDGHVAKLFNTTAGRGNLSYMKIILQELFRYPEFPFEIRTPQQTFKGEAFIMAIANGTEFGNRFKVAPRARHDDGRFNLIVIKKPPFLKLPYLMLRGFLGHLQPSKYYQDYPLTEATIRFSNTVVHVDGEIDEPHLASPLHLKVSKHALHICC